MRLLVDHQLIPIAIQPKSIFVEQICYKRSQDILRSDDVINLCGKIRILKSRHYGGQAISVRLKSKRQRINTITFYLRDILTPLVGVVF